MESLKYSKHQTISLPIERTPVFTEREKHRTILAPYFAEGYSEFLPSLFDLMGYKLENLPMGDNEAAELGLKYDNNDA